jgi:hypothetical protein
MAHWIFTQLEAEGRETAKRWVWMLERDNDRGTLQSDGSFEDLQQCMDDASRHGYYAGHYRVSIRGARSRGSAVVPIRGEAGASTRNTPAGDRAGAPSEPTDPPPSTASAR